MSLIFLYILSKTLSLLPRSSRSLSRELICVCFYCFHFFLDRRTSLFYNIHKEVRMYIKEWAELQEAILAAQLKVLRRFLKKDKKEDEKPARKSRSKMNVAKDILERSSTPLHVAVIINKAKNEHQTIIDRESIVSAISKKVSKGDTFIRVAPNTFGLKDKDYK